jgi:hypothetical protein
VASTGRFGLRSEEPAFSAPSDSYPGLSRFEAELLWRGKDRGPQTLCAWWGRRQIPMGELRRLLPTVWTMAEFPETQLGQRTWIKIFQTAGFVSDSGHRQPSSPTVLYRGATLKRRRGMAWTSDARQATWHAERSSGLSQFNHQGEAIVWSAIVPPQAVLATIGGRNEDEVVVNPGCLQRAAAPIPLSDPPRFDIPDLTKPQ